QDPQACLAELARVVADTAVAITPLGPSWPATESPTDTELFRSIVAAARERAPNALVTTPPLTGFTDSHYFRQLGIVSYGLSPFPLNQTESRGVHGNDERVSLDDIAFGVRLDRKSTRLNSSHRTISYAVFCLKKKNKRTHYHARS